MTEKNVSVDVRSQEYLKLFFPESLVLLNIPNCSMVYSQRQYEFRTAYYYVWACEIINLHEIFESLYFIHLTADVYSYENAMLCRTK